MSAGKDHVQDSGLIIPLSSGGFNHAWSEKSLGWRDIVAKPNRTIVCPHREPAEAPFLFQAAGLFDRKDPVAK